MTLSTWQLIVVGVLAAVWAVVLGVPLVADLLRRRPGSASPVDHHGPRARLGDTIRRRWRHRARPVAGWRAQPVERRRLQILLAIAMSAVGSMFFAIALRGVFILLFLAMLALLVVALTVGVIVGSRERAVRAAVRRAGPTGRDRHPVTGGGNGPSSPTGGGIVIGRAAPSFDAEIDDAPTANPWQSPDGEFTIPTIAEIAEAFRTPDRNGFMFEPLNLDGGRSEADDERMTGTDLDTVFDTDVDLPADPAVVAELGLDLDAVGEPRFEAAPEVGPRQASARARRNKRRQARPIYIESALDENDDQGRVIND